MSDFWKLESKIEHKFAPDDFVNLKFSRENSFRIGNYYINYITQNMYNHNSEITFPAKIFLNISKNNFNFISRDLSLFVAKNDPCTYIFELYHNKVFNYFKVKVSKSNGKERILTFQLSERKILTDIRNLENVNLFIELLESKSNLPREMINMIIDYYIYDRKQFTISNFSELFDTIMYENS